VSLAITRVDAFDVDVPLHSPFGIAGGAQVVAANVFVRITLEDGSMGWGEAAPFPAVNGETRELARMGLEAATPAIVGKDARSWRALSESIARRTTSGSARCALETALVDALCRSWGTPLWSFFGGASTSIETDVTITTGTADEAADAAAKLAAEGIRVLKIKVGGVPLEEDLLRIARIVRAAPGCGLLLDANAALGTPDEALEYVKGVERIGGRVVLFEQPLGKHDLDGLSSLVHRCGVPVAVDESVGSVADVLAVAHAAAANVVNLKPTKSGLIGALDMALAARAHGLGLMMGAMVETPLQLTASACLAAGLGGFDFVDLDTHRWMIDPPVTGDAAFARTGPKIDLSGIVAGHGVVPVSQA
jgi:o-succinylbenzoate synthase